MVMKQKWDILLVDNDAGDVEITEEILMINKVHVKLRVVEKGQDALDWLYDSDHSEYRPDLILLDIDIPGLNGKEFLLKIKRNPWLSIIPIIVISNSEVDDDVRFTYGNGASCYMLKPTGSERYSSAIKALTNFWLECVKLPSKKSNI